MKRAPTDQKKDLPGSKWVSQSVDPAYLKSMDDSKTAPSSRKCLEHTIPTYQHPEYLSAGYKQESSTSSQPSYNQERAGPCEHFPSLREGMLWGIISCESSCWWSHLFKFKIALARVGRPGILYMFRCKPLPDRWITIIFSQDIIWLLILLTMSLMHKNPYFWGSPIGCTYD